MFTLLTYGIVKLATIVRSLTNVHYYAHHLLIMFLIIQNDVLW